MIVKKLCVAVKEVSVLEEEKAETLSPQKEAFTKYSVPRVLAKFILPAALSQLTILILNLADAFFVGRTGDTYQISAMTITFPVMMTISCVANVFGIGANAKMATELGKGNRKRAKTFSSFAVYTSAAVVILLSLILLAAEKPLLYSIGADENSVGFCQNYLLWIFHVGCVPLVLSQVFSQLYLAEGESKISAFGIGCAGLLNVFLDPLFIFGFGMGIAGAGLATCVANYISFGYYLLMFHFRRRTTVVCLDPHYYQAGDHICTEVLSVGIPAGLVLMCMNICDFVRNYFFNLLGGQVELAAWGVVQKIGNSFMQICVGIAQGVRPVIAYNFSVGLVKRVKSMISGSMLVMAVWVAACLVLAGTVPTFLVNLFIPYGDSVPVAVSYLRVWIFCLIGIGFVELLNSIFQAIGKWKISMANTIINKGLLLTPVMILMAKIWGISGMVISQPITEDGTALVLLFLYLIVIKREAAAAQKKEANGYGKSKIQ
ncbi:MAG: hypothetical protein DBX97_04190 [Collinsella tanakaei]|nr:MAG: hypothetical protein DBX97_04190 [Collinsella tanakaei]